MTSGLLERIQTAAMVVCIAALATLLGCAATGPEEAGGSGNGNGNGDDPVGERFYVDGSYVGEEKGTQAEPFNTITEGIDAAGFRDIVVVAAGDYGRGDISVDHVIKIIGAGSNETIVNGRFLVSAPSTIYDTEFRNLRCESVLFASGRYEVAPVWVDSCAVDTVGIGFPPHHSYEISNSTIGGAIFNHGETQYPTINTVRNCVIERDVEFSHGDGPVENTVEYCNVGGRIMMRSGEGATYRIFANTLYEIRDISGANYTTISHNTLLNGSIVDRSGGFDTRAEDQFIEHNTVENGSIELVSWSVTCRYNTVTSPYGETGITAHSGPPCHVYENTVTVPYSNDDASGCIGISASCGDGSMRDNTILGGYVGLLEWSELTVIADNSISGSHVGVRAIGNAGFEGNTITGCVSDGMILDGFPMAIEGNTITDNGGAGVRLFKPADLGGGDQGCPGGNTITGNAGYDLYIEVPATTADVIYARHNTWDFGSQEDIDLFDIYDEEDDASLADVYFWPIAMRGER